MPAGARPLGRATRLRSSRRGRREPFSHRQQRTIPNIDVFYRGTDGAPLGRWLERVVWSRATRLRRSRRESPGIPSQSSTAPIRASTCLPRQRWRTFGMLAGARSSGHGYQTQEITSGIAGDPSAIVNSGYSNIDVLYRGSDGAPLGCWLERFVLVTVIRLRSCLPAQPPPGRGDLTWG